MTFRLGRSDLATGMFHNLRNAMSPLGNQLHRARAALAPVTEDHLARALTELREPATEPTRRTRLLDYLNSAWVHGNTQIAAARREIDAATGQMQAIERILNQQHLDAVENLGAEALALPMLFGESLKLFSGDQLAGVDIDVDPSLAAIPPVAVQRLPMIHVLYNIIANALTAIARQGDGRGRIRVRAAADTGAGKVRLEIIDNGIGVEVALLEEIFRHGYTTKIDRKGGEGLHWCANTLAAGGGRIWAESAGVGNGMTIIIELSMARSGEPAAPGADSDHAG